MDRWSPAKYWKSNMRISDVQMPHVLTELKMQMQAAKKLFFPFFLLQLIGVHCFVLKCVRNNFSSSKTDSKHYNMYYCNVQNHLVTILHFPHLICAMHFVTELRGSKCGGKGITKKVLCTLSSYVTYYILALFCFRQF